MCCHVVVQVRLFLTMIMGEKRGAGGGGEGDKSTTGTEQKQTDLGEETPLASLLTDVDTKRIVPKHRNKNQGQESH